MKSRISKLLLIVLVNFVGWWGANLFNQDLESFFYWNEIAQNPKVFLADITINPKIKETQKEKSQYSEVQGLKLEAGSAISVLITSNGSRKILYEKNIFAEKPIASLTKLMTALVAEKTYEGDEVLTVTKEAVSQEEDKGMLKEGEGLFLSELLHSVLIESSNDAAWVIAEGKTSNKDYFVDEDEFVALMNLEAQNLGMRNTKFINPTGLDGWENYSSCEDLTRLSQHIIEKYPEIFEISKNRFYEVSFPDGSPHHFIHENTNKLLGEIPGIIGGKTGYTEEAGGCVLVILEDEKGNHIINIILGASSTEARFEEMRKLIRALEI